MHELANSLMTAVRAHVARAAVRLCLGFVMVVACVGGYVAGVCLVAIECHRAWGASGVMGWLLVCSALTAACAGGAIALSDRRARVARAAAHEREAAMIGEQSADDAPGTEQAADAGFSKEGIGVAVASVCVVLVVAVVIGPRRLVRWGLRGASAVSFLRSLVPAEGVRGHEATMPHRNGTAPHTEVARGGSRNES